ncbi:signal peptide peptidase SppA [Desulfosarcina sp.]|uniref:signal peptide peptidase SppA n=1 Tax=Desulfosarcina sp. TaxID=2027861 RepID=UPI0029A93062|nr:signal peptide peptidase SppA [Desulfosarcina sp.]MDX2455020.1 signal peptide peptidase SppA [Desulfosarcina sp.]MDX2492591.1 signal peptide peptidase SppA [Desulfosarcina sp.]
MFTRRHPYLFFLLVSFSIFSSLVLGVMAMVAWMGGGAGDFDGEAVGVVEIEGVIADARDTIEHIRRFREDEDIKAIVIRIDSPGGAVGPSQEIYREIRKTVETKKVVASMGAVAASGGYYVACATDGIVANPGTITGSIGVIMGYTNFRQLLDKIGMVPVVIKSGPYKDTGSPTREMRDDEREILQSITGNIHEQFVTAIAEGRKMDRAQVEQAADGRIFTGEDAKARGLVDRLGNFEDALEWAGKLGGIDGEVVPVYARDEKLSLLRYLMSSSLSDWMSTLIHPGIYAEYRYLPVGP